MQSPATLLFNCQIRGIMPIINRPPVGLNKDDEHYEVWVKRQTNNDKSNDTPRMYASIPIGSTVAVQCEDWGPQTHGTVEGKGDYNDNDRSYTIWGTKTEQLITRNSKHVKPAYIKAKQYLQDQLDKHIVTDPLEDILKQLEKPTHTIHTHPQNEQFKNAQNGTHRSNTLHESMTTHNGDDISQNKWGSEQWAKDQY